MSRLIVCLCVSAALVLPMRGGQAEMGRPLTVDQSLSYVNDSRADWVYDYEIQPDGTLKQKQRYSWLHETDTAGDSGAEGKAALIKPNPLEL